VKARLESGSLGHRAFVALASLCLVGVTACSSSATAPPATVAPTPQATAPSSGSPAASESTAPSKPASATLDVWLGGILTTATEGTPYKQYWDDQITRFKSAFPGSDVDVTLLPPDNDQLAAQVQAAFAAHKVPDLMMLYAGSYTLAYQSGLMPLNSYIDATPGFYDAFSGWDAGCPNYDCQGGQADILAVPMDNLAFVLWYNKDFFSKAGVANPPATYDDLYAACDALKSAGYVPMTYGDRDGYTTDNLVLMNLVSYFGPGDVEKFLAGQIPFTDPKWVDPLKAAVELHTRDCVQSDASSAEQLDANNGFITGKTAMEESGPWNLVSMKQGLGDNLGVARLPVSGTGPWKDQTAAMAGEDWVIPNGATHADLAWELIKILTDETASTDYMNLVGYPPANLASAAKITDPYTSQIADWTKDSPLPLMDTVMSQATALVYYKYLQQAFAGTLTPDAAMQAVQQYVDQHGGKP
jgi:raffinose/stachyose/melibiose transport system substrate-binding protein